MDPELGIDVQLMIETLRAADLMPPVTGLHLHGDPGSDHEVLVLEALASADDEAEVRADISRVLSGVPHKVTFWNGEGPRPGASYLASPA